MPLKEKLERLEELQATMEEVTNEIKGQVPPIQTSTTATAGSPARPALATPGADGASPLNRAQMAHGRSDTITSDIRPEFNNLYKVKGRTGRDRVVGLRNAIDHIINTEIRYVEDMELFLEVILWRL